MLFVVFITPVANYCPRGIFQKPLDLYPFYFNLIGSFSRMVTFYFEKLTVCPLLHNCTTDTKAPVVISGEISHLFDSSDKFGMLSDALFVDCIVLPFVRSTSVLVLIGVLFLNIVFG